MSADVLVLKGLRIVIQRWSESPSSIAQETYSRSKSRTCMNKRRRSSMICEYESGKSSQPKMHFPLPGEVIAIREIRTSVSPSQHGSRNIFQSVNLSRFWAWIRCLCGKAVWFQVLSLGVGK